MFLLQVAAVGAKNIFSVSGMISFLQTSPFVLRVFYFLKIILFIYSVILFAAIILTVARARPKKFAEDIKESIEDIIGQDKGKERKIDTGGWKEIVKLVESGQESSWRLAIIEADKFFDGVMRRLGCSGENFSERLTQIHPTEVENINDVWNAHRIRNSLSHDVNFKLSEGEARKAVAAFEKAMKDLEVM